MIMSKIPVILNDSFMTYRTHIYIYIYKGFMSLYTLEKLYAFLVNEASALQSSQLDIF